MKVIMFHYVVPKFNYYHFDLDLFEEKIKYLNSKYKVISLKDYDNLLNITLTKELIISFIVTFIFTYLTFIFLYNKLRKKHFIFFSIYTFILGIILIINNL